MSKTIKIILIFLVVAGVVGAGVYFGTLKTPAPTTTPEGEQTSLPQVQPGESGSGNIPSGEGAGTTGTEAQPGTKFGEVVDFLGAKILYKQPVLDFARTPEGGVILINKKGTIVSISPSGEEKELNNSEIDNPLSATFSTDAKKILVSYGKPSTPQFSVYDTASSTWQPILANVAAAIRPESHEIVYLYEKTGLKNLMLWDLKKPKSTPQQISSLQIEDPVLSFKDKDTLLISERPSAYIKGSILAFSISKKTVTPLIKDKYALHSIWNNGGTTGLAFYGDNTYRGGSLRLYGKGGEEGSKLSLLTLPEKCSFFTAPLATTTAPVSNYLYCAIPRNSQTFKLAIMPDNYFKGAAITEDDLVKINLDDGSLNAVFSPADNPIEIYKISAGEKEVYFLNRNNDALYSVPNK